MALEHGTELVVGHRRTAQGAFDRFTALAVERTAQEGDINNLSTGDLGEAHLTAGALGGQDPVPVLLGGLQHRQRVAGPQVGVGLAAPQIGVDARIFVYDWVADSGVHQRGVAIDPELFVSPLPLGEADEEEDSEGCLSVPGERFPLLRSEHVILRATDLDGARFEVEASGWLARIVQHEFDHLNGILYVDRLAHPHSKAAVKAIKKRSWGSPGQSWLPGRDHLED